MEESEVRLSRTDRDELTQAVIGNEHVVMIDEPPTKPIGNDLAPAPVEYLLVATAGCQAEVLAQCFHKARIEEYDLTIEAKRSVHVQEGDSPEPYYDHMANRTKEIAMEITVETTPEYEDRVQRCLDVAEDACIVSRSLEDGIDFAVEKHLSVNS